MIEATLPVVGEHIGAIAERLYAHLFGEHLELLDGLFNRGNQAEGTQQQALAGSVAPFASALANVREHAADVWGPKAQVSPFAHAASCTAQPGW